MIKKITSLLTALLMFSALVTACGADTAAVPSETASPAETAAEETTAAETEPPRETPDLPDRDFGGYDFHVLAKYGQNTYWVNRDIYAAEQNGEPINDAVFLRNSRIGEKYNFKVTEDAENSDPASAAKKSVLAGDDLYSMLAIGITSYASLATQGILMDWHKIPYIDLSRPWYDPNCTDSLSIAGRAYCASGDMLLMDKDATWSVLFNKKLASDMGLANLYQTVKDGKWTIDFMNTCLQDVSADIDGDGTQGPDDKWGMIGEAWNTNAMIAGAGVRVFSKDENDMPYISMNTEKYYDVFEIASKINGDRSVTMLADWVNSGFTYVWEECIRKAFREDRALFYMCSVTISSYLRMMENDFGIITIPKYTESQDRYYDIISLGSGNGMAVPVTTRDAERTGIIIEALSAESKYTVIPAYYDVTLKTKLARDAESTEMLDLIFSSRVFELGLMFSWGDLFYLPGNMTGKDTTAFASSVEKKISSAEKAMNKDIEKILALDN